MADQVGEAAASLAANAVDPPCWRILCVQRLSPASLGWPAPDMLSPRLPCRLRGHSSGSWPSSAGEDGASDGQEAAWGEAAGSSRRSRSVAASGGAAAALLQVAGVCAVGDGYA